MDDSSETISIDLEDDNNMQKLISEENGASNMLNFTLIIIALILFGPFIILDVFYFYYSFHGGECGNIKDDFRLTINNYLLGQAISILMMLFIIIMGIFLCKCKDVVKFSYKIITYPMIIFSITWLTIGCFVYWVETDRKKCTLDKNTFIFIIPINNKFF
jgi:cytochrome bd-type quinol oxidase subunit 2